MDEKADESFGLCCDLNGKIIEIFYDYLGNDCFQKGKSFPKIFESEHNKNSYDLVKIIKIEDIVFNREVNLVCNDESRVIHVSGFISNQNMLIFGAKSVDDALYFMEHIALMDHEQTRILKGAMNYFTTYLLAQEARESKIYEELGRLNNDLTNAQRELTRNNIQLKKLNLQKEMLIKEVHHRVKNNLMIISSLLNLQSNYLKDEESKEIFKESQNRAKSMALIHERLYRSTDLKNIDFREYITTLAHDLYRTYVNDPSRIGLELNIQDVNMDIDVAIPLGLILNELITNSMKHAFPDGQEGKVSISFGKKGDEFVLKVRDDGIGLPPDMDYTKTNSLGMQLVTSLTSQLNGKLELDNTNGTNFIITFPERDI